MTDSFLLVVIPNTTRNYDDSFVTKIKDEIHHCNRNLDKTLLGIKDFLHKEVKDYLDTPSKRGKKREAILDRINIILNQSCKYLKFQTLSDLESSWIVTILKSGTLSYTLYQCNGESKTEITIESLQETNT